MTGELALGLGDPKGPSPGEREARDTGATLSSHVAFGGAGRTVSDFVMADPRKSVKKHEKPAKPGPCTMPDLGLKKAAKPSGCAAFILAPEEGFEPPT